MMQEKTVDLDELMAMYQRQKDDAEKILQLGFALSTMKKEVAELRAECARLEKVNLEISRNSSVQKESPKIVRESDGAEVVY